MKMNQKFSAIFSLLLVSSAIAAPQTREPVAAVYFMTNDNRGNNIVVHNVAPDGTLTYARSYSTDGFGAITGRTDGPLTPDALRTEGSVVVSGNMLFNANPGSDTVSMFEINPRQPNELKLVGKPVNSGGTFPASVAVSSQTGNVCALNGGSVNGVQCFKQTPSGLVKLPNTNRLLNLPQTTPPTHNDTLFSLSTILFSKDGTKLLADVKGLTTQEVPGFLAVWDVKADGSLSQKPEIFNAPSKIGAQNFGMTYLNGKEGYVVTDPTVGGIVYDFSEGYGPKAKAQNFAVPGQSVVCWVSFASKSNSYFITDFGAPNVFEVTIDDKTLNSTNVQQFRLPENTVNIDSIVGTSGDDQFLYQLAPMGSSLFVFDIQPAGKTKLIQSYNFTNGLTHDHIPFNMLNPQGLAFKAKV